MRIAYLIWKFFMMRRIKKMDRPDYIRGPASFKLYGSENEPTVNVGYGTRVKLFTAEQFSNYYEHQELPWRRRMNAARAALRGEEE